jgi:RNA polymerase sigma factor (sigma-70 family)
MDAYAFVLEALRQDGCRRLKAYVPDGKTKFTTWLVVVTRRLVLDHVRHRYGRSRSDDDARRAEQSTRRRLEDLVADEIDPDQIVGASESPDASVRRAQLTSAVQGVLAGLEPTDRLLLALRFEDERPIKDIARALGLPSVFHVYRRLGVVLAEVRRGLERRGVEEPEA